MRPTGSHEMRPSAEIVRVEGTECRRNCVSGGQATTLCGDRACRVRGLQVKFVSVRVYVHVCATLCGDRVCECAECS